MEIKKGKYCYDRVLLQYLIIVTNDIPLSISYKVVVCIQAIQNE